MTLVTDIANDPKSYHRLRSRTTEKITIATASARQWLGIKAVDKA